MACAEMGVATESLEKVASPNLTLAVSLLLRGAKVGACPVGVLQSPAPAKPESKPEPEQVKAEQAEQPVHPVTPAKEEPEQQKTVAEAIAEKKNASDDWDEVVEDDDDDVAPKRRGWFGRFKDMMNNAFRPEEDMDGSDDEY